ncbi:hypothetical protein HID58_043747 [Brassica napus]|uniref:Uncharacterized protein n=1 Tax=Brassica napus TaxID=3708 RepID=A0ABQ8BHG7_BRANA|nr:hypothetical protein HID58_043747 [Brassica napus]
MNLRGIQIFLLIFEDRSKLSHSESGISLDLDGIFYLGADLEGFLKIGLFGGKSGIQERNLAWECDKLIRSLYLKAGGRMDWGIFFVKPDQGGKALSYKGAVESKALETNSSGDVRRNSQHVSGKQDVKGKGVVYEGGKQVTSGKFGPGRRSKEQGRSTAKYIRNACYLPPQELRDSYAMATGGLNGLRNQDFGAHLDPQQKLMLEAFKSGESGEASGSKACKALLFDNEIGEEGPRELLGDDQAATEVAATVENKDLKEENGMVLSTVENGGKQTLEIESKEDEVIGEMVAGLDEEDGLFELEMMEDGEEEAGLAQDVSAEVKSMEIEEAFSTDEMMEVAGEKDNQAAKKKAGKLMAAAMGGNAKKRLVQSLVSPRKKAMANQGHKAGDKGPLPTKKALVKAKPAQD